MSLIILTTGHAIPVELDPEGARETVEALLEHGHDWGFSELNGAQFQLRHVVAILPDLEVGGVVPAKPAPKAKKKASPK